MGYKMPNVVKEIHLPCNSEISNYTWEQYLEKFGIDFREFVKLKDNRIYINFGLAKTYYVSYDGTGFNNNLLITPVQSISIDGEYERGVSSAGAYIVGASRLKDESYAMFGLYIFISKNDDFNLDNIKIVYFEV